MTIRTRTRGRFIKYNLIPPWDLSGFSTRDNLVGKGNLSLSIVAHSMKNPIRLGLEPNTQGSFNPIKRIPNQAGRNRNPWLSDGVAPISYRLRKPLFRSIKKNRFSRKEEYRFIYRSEIRELIHRRKYRSIRPCIGVLEAA